MQKPLTLCQRSVHNYRLVSPCAGITQVRCKGSLRTVGASQPSYSKLPYPLNYSVVSPSRIAHDPPNVNENGPVKPVAVYSVVLHGTNGRRTLSV